MPEQNEDTQNTQFPVNATSVTDVPTTSDIGDYCQETQFAEVNSELEFDSDSPKNFEEVFEGGSSDEYRPSGADEDYECAMSPPKKRARWRKSYQEH